jgi:hypothetical protein
MSPKPFFDQGEVQIKERITRDIHLHEVFLSFNCDVQAEAFCDWWTGEGIEAFEEWTKDNGGNYE